VLLNRLDKPDWRCGAPQWRSHIRPRRTIDRRERKELGILTGRHAGRGGLDDVDMQEAFIAALKVDVRRLDVHTKLMCLDGRPCSLQAMMLS
jgi:hypothetical protein